MRQFLSTLFVVSVFFSFSQKETLDPTIEPSIFGPDDEITITYDVSNTSLTSLEEAWIWLWLPEESAYTVASNVNPADSDPSATDPARFSKSTEDGKTLFSITLRLSDYIETSTDYTKVGMLLKANDWSGGQTTDYLSDVITGFAVILNHPSGEFSFYERSEEITIDVSTSEVATIEILVDNVSISSNTDVVDLKVAHTIIDDGELHEIKARATNGIEKDSIIHTYGIIKENSIPDGLIDGINYQSATSASLVLTAPGKNHVFLIGDFNDWDAEIDYLMNKDGDKFWYTLSGLTPGIEYRFQYLVDSEIRIADPYSEKVSSNADDPEIISEGRYPGLPSFPSETTEEIGYIQTGKSEFQWSSFDRPDQEDLIIYEMLIRDFTEERNFQSVIDSLDYLADLGINALELMPVMEFEGNLSWGYNPSSMLAVDKYYGTEEQLKILIDEAHQRGIAVILDIVLNHQFGRNSLVKLYNEGVYGNPTEENPWFNVTPKHDFNVGYDMNHENELTIAYVSRVVNYWIDEYNIDGYRFDLSKGFTQNNTLGNTGRWGEYDASRIEIWKNIADDIWSNDPGFYIILEHFAENDEEKELAEYGMMLWGNMNDTYRRAARGSSVSMSNIYHESRGWSEPHLVGYMESHDEERQMFWLTEEDGLTTEEALKREMLTTCFFLTVPGPKMIWQFGEFGYDLELNDDRLGIKPTRWEYLEDPKRRDLFKVYKSLTNLRTKTNYVDSEYFNWSTNGWIKTINITHPEVDIYVIGNFDTDDQIGNHAFTKSGTWYNYLTGSSIEVSDPNEEVTLSGGSFYIYTSEPIDNYLDENLVLGLEAGADVFNIYPNPTPHKVFFDSNYLVQSVVIKDLSGKAIKRIHPLENRISLEGIRPGIYLIEVETDKRRITQKVIKK